MNLPYNCSDRELREWIESWDIHVESVRIIKDLVSEASPAFAYATLNDCTRLDEAIALLSGSKMRSHTVTVERVAVRSSTTNGRR